MVSVTQRIRKVVQPRGGYVNAKLFNVGTYQDNKILHDEENIHASLVGMAVDYLTRYMIGSSKVKAFRISLMGADFVNDYNYAMKLLSGIESLDEQSIINAVKLVGYDSAYRAGIYAYKEVRNINPDKKTIENIRTMVERGQFFFKKYGPITKNGFTFGNGYTNIISSGDGDFLTKDTLWDFKVPKKELDKNSTLQILVYYLMGKRSGLEVFDAIENIGIFNPRLNKVYQLKVEDIPKEIIEVVETNVIGYVPVG